MLLFGPFSIGILAAIAIPAYQDYTIRAQITEGLMAADPFKAAIAQAASLDSDWSKINSERLGVPLPDNLKYVNSIVVESGAIIIEYSPKAHAKIQGKILLIAPGLNADRDIIWFCGHTPIPAGISMAVENSSHYTTVADAYLPTMCRSR
jgi:type IV pilus assembly protein PilA